jgi:hypothetical protein
VIPIEKPIEAVPILQLWDSLNNYPPRVSGYWIPVRLNAG